MTFADVLYLVDYERGEAVVQGLAPEQADDVHNVKKPPRI